MPYFCLRAVMDEESQAGWDLLEKLDDRRLRCKRLKKSGQKDEFLSLGYAAYHTEIGRTEEALGGLIALAIIGLISFVGLGVFLFNSQADNGTSPSLPMIIIAFTTLLLLIVFIVKRLRR